MKWSEKNSDMAGTQAAMIRAGRRALLEARMRREPVPQWRDGKVVWVDPEEIELPALPDDEKSTNGPIAPQP